MTLNSHSAPSSQPPSPFSRRRYAALALILLLWCGAAAVRLFQMQILRYRDFAARAQRQQQRTIEVSPRRGVLYDRNYHELAMSIQVDSVFAAPAEIPQPENTAALLARVLDLDAGELLARLKASRSFCWVKRKVDQVEAERVRSLNLKGVYLQKESKRFYPKGELAAQVLGYVGLDENGLAGVEQEFDRQVRGKPGLLLIQADAHHRWFGRQEKPPDPGENLVLSLDENIQYIVERELAAAVAQTHPEAATALVINPNSGELLAVANWPSFNPNQYRRSSPEMWQNRAVSAAYEPGSTFKVITVSAALEEKLTRPDEVFDCQMGAINVFGRIIHDHHPFGLLSVSQIIEHSSDVGAIKIALRVGPERMYHYMRALGFGSATRVELPGEARGLLRPPEHWSKNSIGSIAMGQEVGVTPLQMAAAISAIANGGILYRPHIVRERFRQAPPRSVGLDLPATSRLAPALGAWPPDPGPGLAPFAATALAVVSASTRQPVRPEGRRILSQETAVEMRKMMEQVVLSGTGRAARLNGYTAAGKTGTAQKVDPVTHAYSKTKYVGSFIGFAPSTNPAVAITVILDSPVGLHQGGQVAAPVFKRIAEQVLGYLEVPHDLPVLPETQVVRVNPEETTDFPSSASDSEAVAEGPAPPLAPCEGARQTSRLAPVPPGRDARPAGPGPGRAPAPVRRGSFAATSPCAPADAGAGVARTASLSPVARTAVFDLEKATGTPAFVGKPLRVVVEEALAQGLEVELVGSGIAREQTPPAGAPLALGSKVVVRFSR